MQDRNTSIVKTIWGKKKQKNRPFSSRDRLFALILPEPRVACSVLTQKPPSGSKPVWRHTFESTGAERERETLLKPPACPARKQQQQKKGKKKNVRSLMLPRSYGKEANFSRPPPPPRRAASVLSG